MPLLIIIALLAAIGAAAAVWGVDSRDDSPDPRSPARGLA
jgi:hypothetical protein